MTATSLSDQLMDRPEVHQVDAVTGLTLFIVTLTVLPARYVVGALGSAGTPAGIVAVLCLAGYLMALITPKTTPLVGHQPLRTIVLVFLLAILASYAADVV